MTITETACEKCGFTPKEETSFCGECGAENPWQEQPVYKFDEDDFPIVFSYECYDDDWGLWREFCSQYFDAYELKGKDIAGLPDDFPEMKYCVHNLWFVVTRDLELKGPFESREIAENKAEVWLDER